MPLYEYECLKHGHRFELIRKFADPPLERCIHCSSKVRKLVSSSSISFKGSGWYVTDYAGRKGSEPAGGNGKGKGASSSDSGAAEGGSESKSASSGAGGPDKKSKRKP